jgi:hypothetical protein
LQRCSRPNLFEASASSIKLLFYFDCGLFGTFISSIVDD